ncbi:MAG: sodium:solute symporter family protein [Myxococcales bacterium]|nr:sodium:solute symporter family protein [Myxococcales bacterium]
MRYLELIEQRPLVWGLFVIYLVLTSALAWMGHRRTKDMTTFAVGSGDMNPIVVGITLAASIASTATFVINPGFVYVHGISALMHLGVAAGLGIIVGLVVMSGGFRRIGAQKGALTLPGWIGERYESRALRILFAAINLLSLSFVVLIVAGLSIVVQSTLGLTHVEALVLIVGFVFGYVFIGGTYAHAYTNTLQGILMAGVSLLIVGSGLSLLSDGWLDRLAQKGDHLATLINPTSPLFGSFFSVFVCGFVIGFALVCQPHIMSKALYVKDDRAVKQYLGVTVLVSLAFTALLLVGIYAHLSDMPKETFVDPATGTFRQDAVMTVYLQKSFGPGPLALITVTLLAAGMSTLDGILVALSSIASSDLVLPLAGRFLAGKSDEERARFGHRASQLLIVAFGVGAFALSLNPPKLLGIFGQLGVYGIVAASTVPILFGILFPRLDRRVALASASLGVGVHFALYAWGQWAVARGVDLVQAVEGSAVGFLFDTHAAQLGLANPGVTATYGILASALLALPFALRGRVPRQAAAMATL